MSHVGGAAGLAELVVALGAWALVVSLVGCAASSDTGQAGVDAPSANGESALKPSMSAGGETEFEVMADGPSYETLDEVLADASVSVRGTVTRKLGTDILPDTPHVTWAMWELVVEDDLGSSVPETLALVDFDYGDETDFPDGLVHLSDGLSGLFFLDSHKLEDGGEIHPDYGITYHAVAIFQEGEDGFIDQAESVETIQSLDAARVDIVRDNHAARD